MLLRWSNSLHLGSAYDKLVVCLRPWTLLIFTKWKGELDITLISGVAELRWG